MNNLKVFGKFLDQPILISKLNKAMPALMSIGGGAILAKNAFDVFNKNDDKDVAKKEVIKKSIIMATSIASALIAPKIASKIVGREPIETFETIAKSNQKIIDDFLAQNKITKEIEPILNKAKEKVLSLGDIKKLAVEFTQNENGKEFFNKLIPEPQNIKANDIFSEIGYLSIYGAIPVLAGIVGGTLADTLNGEDYKKNISDKFSEGIYQYLANIFMCNIGAGVALALLEKMNITSKTARAVGMISGIVLTGVIGGSKIANFVSEKVIAPLTKSKTQERKPEVLDLCLHMDDIATVSLLSGLKWIEPALPVLYSISGYKAGSGYRN